MHLYWGDGFAVFETVKVSLSMICFFLSFVLVATFAPLYLGPLFESRLTHFIS